MTRRISQEEVVEEVEFFLPWGFTPERIAERLDSRVDTLARALYRAHRPELAAPFTSAYKRKRNRRAA